MSDQDSVRALSRRHRPVPAADQGGRDRDWRRPSRPGRRPPTSWRRGCPFLLHASEELRRVRRDGEAGLRASSSTPTCAWWCRSPRSTSRRTLPHPGPDPGGQPGPDARRREVRLAPGLQVLDLRHLVDPPGDRPGHRQHVPDRPPPGSRRRSGAPRAASQGSAGGSDRADCHSTAQLAAPPPDAPKRTSPPSCATWWSRSAWPRRSGPRARPSWPTSCPIRRSDARSMWSPAGMLGDEIDRLLARLERAGAPDPADCATASTGASPGPWRRSALELNLTRERIRQIERTALAKLRHPLADLGARDLLAS